MKHLLLCLGLALTCTMGPGAAPLSAAPGRGAASASAVSVATDDGTAPLWLRHCRISPDGSQIAFCYKGDIYVVGSGGGLARQLTTHAAYDTEPLWSPDGRQIAFTSDRSGWRNLYVVDAEGGTPVRLTRQAVDQLPLAFDGRGHLLCLAASMPSPESRQFPSAQFKQVYEVDLEGRHAVRMVSSLPMEDVSVSPDGARWLYHDKKGYEDDMRKHHTSSITRDVWLYDVATRSHRQLTTAPTEDRNPVWAADGRTFYYLSEASGSMNVCRQQVDGSSAPVQLTHHTMHPVRHLSASRDGLLCYSYDGELYTLREGGEPRRVDVRIRRDDNGVQDVVRQVKTNGVTDFAVAPDGKEVAFVVRGDVYVTSVEYRTTRRITDTPTQERSVDFAPDGRAVVYAAERDGLWQIYQTRIKDDDERQMVYASELVEERVTRTEATSFQPLYSPDGKEVAYLEDRSTLRVVNLKSHESRTVMDGQYEYSYSDGDQSFCWSPDSRWLLTGYIGVGGWNNPDIALVKADGSGELHDLTESGYNDVNPKWALDGKAMIWESDRAGYRSHGSWGAEMDVYIMFFDLEAYEAFLRDKEQQALADAATAAGKKDRDKGDADSTAVANGKPKKVKPLEFDLGHVRDRVVRLTVGSSRLSDALLSKKGDVLYYISSFMGRGDLWKHDLKENRTEIVERGIGRGSLLTDAAQKSVFFLSGGTLRQLGVGGAKAKSIEFEALFDYRPAEERAYMFDHIWRQVADKFYAPDIHGIDWAAYRESYRRFLPHISNNEDLREMLSEMLGELNGSHTGARYYRPAATPAVGHLGIFWDDTYTGRGLRVAEVIDRGPLTLQTKTIGAGAVLLAVDGVALDDAHTLDDLLAGRIGRTVRLRFDKGEVSVKPISQAAQQELLYRRWVERNRAEVERLSGGRLGYVHIKGMNSESFRTLYSELLGRYRGCEAVVIDTRHNGGGWLHDDVVTLLGAKEYTRYIPHGRYIGSDPYNKWTKPSCMLVCEDNYSNAHGTPWLYKELGIGKLIGAPVPGTMTAVWWETLIDPTMVFGIPQVGSQDMHGAFLENQQLEPDVLIYNDPADVQQGRDAQLEKAVEVMLSDLKK